MRALSVDQIEKGCVKILENAGEIIEDAELLLEKGRFARAYYLAHLACEELAKVPMLVGAAVDMMSGRECDWPGLHRRLHSHTDKILGIIVVDYFTDQNIEKGPDVEKLKEDIEKTTDYKKLKEQSLYTALIDESFKKPSELINPETAGSLVRLARERLDFFESLNLPKGGTLAETIKSPLFKDLSERFIEPLRGRMPQRRR